MLPFIVAILVARIPCADPPGQKDRDHAWKLAQEMAEIKDVAEVFKKWDMGHLPHLRQKASETTARQKQASGMRAALENAIAKHPEDPEGYLILGNMALREGRVTEASLLYARTNELVAGLQDASRRQTVEVRLLSGLAAVAEARDRWAEAQSSLESLLKVLPAEKGGRSPARAQAINRLAWALFQQGEAQRALETARAAHLADPQATPVAEVTIARLYELFGGHANACKWMFAAIAKAPDHLPTRLAVARWALETNQMDLAQGHADKALQIDPQSVGAKVLRGWIALWQEDYAAAEKHFEDARALDPGDFAASDGLALALCEQKDANKRNRALDVAVSNLGQQPTNFEAMSTYRPRFLWWDNDARRARSAVPIGNDADAVYCLARVFVSQGRKKEAQDLLRGVLMSTIRFAKRPDAMAELVALDPQAQRDIRADDTVVIAAEATVLRGESGSTTPLPVGTLVRVQEVRGGLLRVELDEALRGTVPCNAVIKP
jgi:tetratricopeptide (TPR) repeat protein